MPDPPAEHDATPEPVTRPDHHGTGVEHPDDEQKPKRSLRRKAIRLFLLLIAFGVLLVVLAPMLLSTGPGTRWLVSVINGQAPGELTIDDLSLSWLGGQRVEGVSYTDSDQGLDVTITSIDANEVSLLGLVRGSHRYGLVELEGFDLTYSELEASTSARESSEPNKPASDEERFSLPEGTSGKFAIKDLTVTYQPLESDPIQLTIDDDEIEITDLRDISFELNAIVRQGTRAGSLTLEGGVLNFFDPDGVEQADQAAYDVTFDVKDLPTVAIDQVLVGMSEGFVPGRLVALLGDGELVSKATVKGTIEKLKSDLTIITPKLHIELDQLTEGDTLVASPESFAELKLDQDGFDALFPKSGLKLFKPTQINLASLQMSLPIVKQAVDWDKSTAAALVQAAGDFAVVDERGEKLWINDLKIVGKSGSIADKVTFKLTTMLSAVTGESQATQENVSVDLTISDPLNKTRKIDFFSETLPIKLTDALLGQEGRLVLYLDEILTLQADVQGRLAVGNDGGETVEQHYSLRPDGRVTGTVSGSFTEGRFTLATPANEPIEAELTPEAFANLMELFSGTPGQPALTIDQSIAVFLTLRDATQGPVTITTRQDKVGLKGFYPDPDQTTLAATIELSTKPTRVFDPKLKKSYELRGGVLSISAPDLRGKTHIEAELNLRVRPNAGEEGVASLLTWQTTVTDLLDTEGSVPLDSETLMQQIAAEGGLQTRNVPSGLLDSLLNRDGDLASILGPIVQQMDAGFTYQDGQPTGATVRLNWDDKTNQPTVGSWASMKPAAFDIDTDQMLTVRGGGDLELQVRVSEDFGDRWMGKLHPILFDAKSGDRPVKIKIDGKSFRFPLQGDKMKGSRVEAQVDLGTIEFGDRALLGKILEWTDRPGERAIFEPANVKLVDGNISYDQFDLAVGKVKLRLDGEVDLASGQIVDMAVRVPGDSLIRVFSELEGVIKHDDYLSIPMTGAIRKPEFDSKLIGREVARLVAAGLIDRQKDKLGDLIKKGIGGDKDKPKPDEGDLEEKEDKSVEEELIDRGLELLFKRLGKDKD